jgi:N6-L-threonylcarbamoyladenine synthase
VDDAAGEAFDKVAKMLGLGYPGGPEIERRARRGDPKRFDLPRSMLDSRDHNFSFSGLKTSVRYLIAKLPRTNSSDALDDETIDDVCASFQQAAIEVLVRKTIRAAHACRKSFVTLSGGVSCNVELRHQVRAACEAKGFEFLAAPAALSTDNAVMIGFAAGLRFAGGFVSNVADEIDPNLALA